ncbi:DUF177 domain-containing protein [Parasphingopyxis algicola]|uniref:YceD family protein n=1 Tax=Parasphingopyxis algicola TaxID=2026624 RepID=UPI00159F8D11|nr:DUF177 domain-containing protein [Parasphingopyxis algicola]QLC25583.1 DUF177 domain-containing protein [Parasphingopyxis algicola]
MSVNPEFSRRIAIDTIGAGAATHEIEADANERAALAERFDLQALPTLSARAEIRREGADIFARGEVYADVTQRCVVTGEPVTDRIEADFDLRFVPEDLPVGAEEIELSADECETMIYTDGAIDLGEAAAQTMALALDPFPRSANAEAALRAAGVISEEEAGPFGTLKALRDQLSEKRGD